jgi:hypothetical protein
VARTFTAPRQAGTERLVACPGKACGVESCGELVAAWGFESFDCPVVEVDPCSKLLRQGWVGVQLVEYKSQAGYLLGSQETVTVWAHRDGLITFTG